MWHPPMHVHFMRYISLAGRTGRSSNITTQTWIFSQQSIPLLSKHLQLLFIHLVGLDVFTSWRQYGEWEELIKGGWSYRRRQTKKTRWCNRRVKLQDSSLFIQRNTLSEAVENGDHTTSYGTALLFNNSNCLEESRPNVRFPYAVTEPGWSL